MRPKMLDEVIKRRNENIKVFLIAVVSFLIGLVMGVMSV